MHTENIDQPEDHASVLLSKKEANQIPFKSLKPQNFFPTKPKKNTHSKTKPPKIKVQMTRNYTKRQTYPCPVPKWFR